MIGTWKQHSSKMTITCRYWWIENLTAKAISHKDLDFFCKTSCLLKTQNWGLEKRKQIYCSLHESYLALLDTLVVRGAPPERHGFFVDSMSSAARPSQTSPFAGVPQISLMMHFIHAFSATWVFSFLSAISILQIDLSLQLHSLTWSISILSLYPVPVVKGPQGTIMLMAQRWAC